MGALLICGSRSNAVEPLAPRLVKPAKEDEADVFSRHKSSEESSRNQPCSENSPLSVSAPTTIPTGRFRRHSQRVRPLWEPNREGLSPQSVTSFATTTTSISACPVKSLHQSNFSQGSFVTDTCDHSGNTIALSIASQVLRNYNVKALIGRGSFSRVLRVESKGTKELYALKIVEKRQLEGNNYQTELNLLQLISHPNVVKLHEAFQSSKKAYYVIELAAGGDLFDRLDGCGHFTESLSRRTARMILSGVAYLHSMGVTHRDLKLENLLYVSPGEDSKILISDFGLAHLRSGAGEVDEAKESAAMLTLCGSAEYLAPEMLEGEPYTELVDCWSMGVVIFTMLSGAMPFVDGSRARLYNKIRNGQYSFGDQVSTCCVYPWHYCV